MSTKVTDFTSLNGTSSTEPDSVRPVTETSNINNHNVSETKTTENNTTDSYTINSNDDMNDTNTKETKIEDTKAELSQNDIEDQQSDSGASSQDSSASSALTDATTPILTVSQLKSQNMNNHNNQLPSTSATSTEKHQQQVQTPQLPRITEDGSPSTTPPLMTPITATSSSLQSPKLSFSVGSSSKWSKLNEIEEMDSDLKSFMQRLENARDTATNGGFTDISELLSFIELTGHTVLRLNLNKNLIKCQLKSNQEDYSIERQLLFKNMSKFEKDSKVWKKENEIINLKNLKLIKYCKTLKNEKFKLLRIENSDLKRQISNLTDYIENNGLSPTTTTPTTASQKRKRKLSTSQSSASPSSDHLPIRISDINRNSESNMMTSNSANSVNMLDTLGRLASHVLEDEEFNLQNQQ